MPLDPSSISTVCNEIIDYLRDGLNASANNIAVSMGAPAALPDADDEHQVNLFFYRFEPGGFQTDAHPNDPWRIRMYCMITTFGVDEESIAAGEHEMRMLGEIMRLFRARPVSEPVVVGSGSSTETVRLQTIFSAATDEQMNQVWSTQGEKAFHPSVIYEMALTPIMPAELRAEPPLVGSIGSQSRAHESGRYSSYTGATHAPKVPLSRVDVANPLWQPVIAWVHDDACHHTLALDASVPGFSFTPRVWLAGDPSDSVDLVWQTWTSSGWEEISTVTPALPFGTELNPEEIPATVPGSFPIELTLPISLDPGENAAQALLYAERSVVLAAGAEPVIVRSNPLLVSLYRGS